MIRLRNIKKAFDGLCALKDVSLEVADGSIFGLIGTNGAGKSTLLRIMAGIYQPDEGEALLDDSPVFEQWAVKSRLFYISDDPFFLNGATLEEMRRYYCTLYPDFSQDTYLRITASLQLDPARKLSTYSKGMLRQAMIILAFASQARYVFFDETFDGLDPVMRQAVKGLIAASVAEGKLVPIIASHNLRELEDICDHVGVLHRGEIVLNMRLDQMQGDIQKVQCAFQERPQREWFDHLQPLEFKAQGRFCTLIVRASEDEALEAVRAHQPLFLESMPLTLEEIFIAQMGGIGYEVQSILV